MFKNQDGRSPDFFSGAASWHHQRVYLYLLVIFIVVLFTTCEMKTGVSFVSHEPFHPNEGPERVHEPWTWKQVAGELPDTLARRIALAMLLIVIFEFGFQSGRWEKKRNGTGG